VIASEDVQIDPMQTTLAGFFFEEEHGLSTQSVSARLGLQEDFVQEDH
jgi:hypothetical protein